MTSEGRMKETCFHCLSIMVCPTIPLKRLIIRCRLFHEHWSVCSADVMGWINTLEIGVLAVSTHDCVSDESPSPLGLPIRGRKYAYWGTEIEEHLSNHSPMDFRNYLKMTQRHTPRVTTGCLQGNMKFLPTCQSSSWNVCPPRPDALHPSPLQNV